MSLFASHVQDLLASRLVRSFLLTSGIIFFWLVVHLGASLLGFRMADRHFEHDSWLYKIRPFERSRRFYRFLRVHQWKDRLPEGDALVKDGFRKKHLMSGPLTTDYLDKFCIESRRAEYVHWIAMAPGPLFFLSGNIAVGVSMTLYAALANLPCILAQRYNRERLQRVRDRLARADVK
ncbi:MAG: glycosyl-4,4'-diaponeurosporenoate acyltransferase [Firmicutes bacterium]|nr:glycosyl-4,4'-diaponeurosporenoate acyltransferase [Bacillota bacterium]